MSAHLTRFQLRQRIRVTAPEPDHAELRGRGGTVVRLLRRKDQTAWVEMDNPLPEEVLHVFPADSPRARHVLLAPEECEEEPR